MKEYEVTLTALSSKRVKVLAKDSDTALSLANKIYNQTTIMDFNDTDVEGVIAEITDCNNVCADDYFNNDNHCKKDKCCSIEPNRRRPVE